MLLAQIYLYQVEIGKSPNAKWNKTEKAFSPIGCPINEKSYRGLMTSRWLLDDCLMTAWLLLMSTLKLQNDFLLKKKRNTYLTTKIKGMYEAANTFEQHKSKMITCYKNFFIFTSMNFWVVSSVRFSISTIFWKVWSFSGLTFLPRTITFEPWPNLCKCK